MLSIRNTPNTPRPDKDEKLPWGKLYNEFFERAANYEPDEWENEERMERENLERDLRNEPSPPPMPISLELLASTAAALRPLFGANGATKEEVTKKNKRVVAHAYDLLSECGSLLSRAEYAAARHAHLKERQRERRELDEKSLKIKLTDAVLTITGYKGPEHAKRYFRMFLEVFYGEVFAINEVECRINISWPPFPTHFDVNGEWEEHKKGNYKQWATWTYERYQAGGLRKDEVVFLTEKFTELTERGFIEKSTPRKHASTKAKKRKTKG